MKNIYLFLIFTLDINFITGQDYMSNFHTEPIKIVAHTDSSIFIFGKKELSENKFDLFQKIMLM